MGQPAPIYWACALFSSLYFSSDATRSSGLFACLSGCKRPNVPTHVCRLLDFLNVFVLGRLGSGVELPDQSNKPFGVGSTLRYFSDGRLRQCLSRERSAEIRPTKTQAAAVHHSRGGAQHDQTHTSECNSQIHSTCEAGKFDTHATHLTEAAAIPLANASVGAAPSTSAQSITPDTVSPAPIGFKQADCPLPVFSCGYVAECAGFAERSKESACLATVAKGGTTISHRSTPMPLSPPVPVFVRVQGCLIARYLSENVPWC